jgi:hypothetical protein
LPAPAFSFVNSAAAREFTRSLPITQKTAAGEQSNARAGQTEAKRDSPNVGQTAAKGRVHHDIEKDTMSDSDVCQTCGTATPPNVSHNGWACLLEMQQREEARSSPPIAKVRGFRLFGHRFRIAAFGNHRMHRATP